MKNSYLKLDHISNRNFNQLWKLVSDEKVTQYLTWDVYKKKSELKKYISNSRKKTGYPDEVLGIYLKDQLIGTIHMIIRKSTKIQFGFGLLRQYWGKNYATTACMLALKHLSNNWLNESRKKAILWADIDTKNIAAKKVVKKLGFKLEKKSIESNRDRYTLKINKPKHSVHKYIPSRSKQKNAILNNLLKVFSNNDRVFSIFLTGSTARQDWNMYSDLDVWIVISEEKDLNVIVTETQSILSKIGELVGVYKCTEQHYFGVYQNLELLDINFITCAQYFSITSKDKKFLPKTPSQLKTKVACKRTYVNGEIEQYFLKGYAGIFRIMSKVENNELWEIPRFLNSVRDLVLLPLMSVVYGYKIPNTFTIDISIFKKEHKNLLTCTFSKPTKEDGREGILAAYNLLKLLFHDSKKKFKLNNLSSFVKKADQNIRKYFKDE